MEHLGENIQCASNDHATDDRHVPKTVKIMTHIHLSVDIWKSLRVSVPMVHLYTWHVANWSRDWWCHVTLKVKVAT